MINYHARGLAANIFFGDQLVHLAQYLLSAIICSYFVCITFFGIKFVLVILCS